jgi:hypothetical protein
VLGQTVFVFARKVIFQTLVALFQLLLSLCMLVPLVINLVLALHNMLFKSVILGLQMLKIKLSLGLIQLSFVQVKLLLK